MKARIFTLCLLLCLAITTLSCQKKQTTNPKPPSPQVFVSFCIDMLGIKEPIFTQPVLNTLLSLEKSGTFVLSKEICTDKSEYRNKLSLCAEKSDLIIAGPLMAEELIYVSKLYPDKFFLLLDYPGQGKNVVSVIFKEDELAKRAMVICQNNSKTKKTGALFQGDPSSPLSLVLINILKPSRVDFVPYRSNSSIVVEKLREYEKEGIDFIFLDRAPYLEEVITTLSKNNEYRFSIVCPRIILPNQSSHVFATIEKNYHPILSKLIADFIRKELEPKTNLVSDFGSVLTR